MLAGFNWIVGRSLAGSARPGLLAELDDDLAFLRGQGIVRIVSLTRRPLEASAATEGLSLLHFPVADMGIPTPRACEGLCRSLADDLDERPVLLHCRGGLGRTGTLAACLLVTLGRDPERALAEVRAVNPNYIQSPAQVGFIGHYADWLARA